MDDASATRPISEDLTRQTGNGNENAVGAAMAHIDEDDEWEYEYSTTETETHLLTLDLSIPDFVEQPEAPAYQTRGGIRTWVTAAPTSENNNNNTTTNNNKQNNERSRSAKKATLRHAGLDEEDDEDNDDNADDIREDSDDGDGDEEMDRAATDHKDTRAKAKEADATEVQILELHSAEPLVAYRGRTFKGAWTETIGTELLFTKRQSSSSATESSLPALHLPQDVDLLGASTARIVCAPVELQERRALRSLDDIKQARKRRGFSIPVPHRAPLHRFRQAEFLETLMTIKHRRGDADVVTVQAVETKHDQVAGDEAETRLRQRKSIQAERYSRKKKARLERRTTITDVPK